MKSILPIITGMTLAAAAASSAVGLNARTGLTLDQYEIVFDSDRSGFQELYVMAADGSNVRQITHRRNRMPDHDARWVWGEDKVAFQSYRRGGWRTWTINIDGSEAKRFSDYGNYEAEAYWSKSTDKVVFSSYRPTMNLFIANKSGKVLKQLTFNRDYSVLVDHGKFSDDGQLIAYVSNKDGDFDIFTMNADGSNATQHTNNTAADFSPSFSPDGKKLMYYSDAGGNFDTYILDVSTNITTKITSNPSESNGKYRADLMEGPSSFKSLAPSWSPDGKWIAFFCFENQNAEICVSKPDGTERKRITTNNAHDGAPTWRFKP
ncbi:MAG: hypothetical protein COB37_05470 [Kordiimonadales bacterium]|nr:MAG: hypothetical protein COB37_05470 [Kordiimonadales bacterium]